MRLLTGRRWITIAVVALAACHDATKPVGGASIRFSGAVSAADTIGATIPQALLVEVHDSSGAVPPAGTVVRFVSVVTSFLPEARVAPLTSRFFESFAADSTDGAGRTAVLIRLGTIAGTARVVVSVPTLGLQDTARFTVNPGNAFRVMVSPFDTALYVGKSFALRGGVIDAGGNPRNDPVTWISSGPGLTVTSAGLVTGAAVGRYTITAAGFGGGWGAAVSVVPPGRLLGWTWSVSSRATPISAFDVDGSNAATLTTAINGTYSNGSIDPHPAWIPGTSTVVYTSNVGADVAAIRTLYTVGADGVARPFFAATPPTVTHEAEPTPSADGQWMYFSAYDTRCSTVAYCVSRAKIDGTAEELLVATPSMSPAPSPDGSKVAYVASGQIRVLDVAARTTSSWTVSGSVPAWSPDGTQIAYLDPTGALSFVAPDGTGARTLSPGVYPAWSLSWSPDGKWVVGNPSGTAALIDAATGATLSLRYTNGSATSMK